jgi:hypothetical protein
MFIPELERVAKAHQATIALGGDSALADAFEQIVCYGKFAQARNIPREILTKLVDLGFVEVNGSGFHVMRVDEIDELCRGLRTLTGHLTPNAVVVKNGTKS